MLCARILQYQMCVRCQGCETDNVRKASSRSTSGRIVLSEDQALPGSLPIGLGAMALPLSPPTIKPSM